LAAYYFKFLNLFAFYFTVKHAVKENLFFPRADFFFSARSSFPCSCWGTPWAAKLGLTPKLPKTKLMPNLFFPVPKFFPLLFFPLR
jgi:hypothetical protein